MPEWYYETPAARKIKAAGKPPVPDLDMPLIFNYSCALRTENASSA
jgi:hypothetical protein